MTHPLSAPAHTPPPPILFNQSLMRLRELTSASFILLFSLCEIFEEHFGCNWMVKPLRSQKSRIFTVY